MVRMKRSKVERFGLEDEYLCARGQPCTMRNRVLVRDFAARYRAQAGRGGRDLFSYLDSNLERVLAQPVGGPVAM